MAVQQHAPGLDRLGDVLDSLRAHRSEGEVEALAHPLAHLARDAHPAGLGQPLEPGGDVDAIAIDVLALDNDVAKVNPDAEADALGLGEVRLPPRHALLDRDRAGDGVHHARELAEHAVARQLDDPAAVLGDERLDQLLAVGLQPGQRAGLVLTHEPRVADHVGRQDGGEPPLDTCRSHAVPSADSR